MSKLKQAKINCNIVSCKYHINDECTMINHIIILSSDKKYTCWQEDEVEKNNNDKYPMGKTQPAQIDCRISSCKYHINAVCTNIALAITLNENKNFVCWTKDMESEDKSITILSILRIKISELIRHRFLNDAQTPEFLLSLDMYDSIVLTITYSGISCSKIINIKDSLDDIINSLYLRIQKLYNFKKELD